MRKKGWIKGSSILLSAIMACSVIMTQPVSAAEPVEENQEVIVSEEENEGNNISPDANEEKNEDVSGETETGETGKEDQVSDSGEEKKDEKSGTEEDDEKTDVNTVEIPKAGNNDDNNLLTDVPGSGKKGDSEDRTVPSKSEDDFPATASYDQFISLLPVLEGYAEEYAAENTKEDPDALVINFIRTGVSRYNSDSWAIIAGSEKTAFVEYVLARDTEEGTEATSLRNLQTFNLPNGDIVDFGHMFGTMDIMSYKGDVHSDTADMGGWAGDVCDLASYSKNHGVTSTDVDGMADEIRENYLHVDVENEHAFGDEDIHGDLDGYYLMSELKKGSSSLSGIMSAYFTEDLTEADRAVYFLKNHFAGKNTKETVRDALYNTYKNNSGIIMLEADRGLSNDTDLTKACSYAFSDYLYDLAKEELGGEDPDEPGPENPDDPDPVMDNEYYSVFSSKESSVAPGVTQQIKYATTADGKQLAYYIAYADVSRDDVTVCANYNNNTADTWKMARVSDQMEAARARHTDPDDPDHYIENYNPVVGINADFYNMSTGVPSGLLVMEGVLCHDIGNEGFFGILKDGTAMIGSAADWEAHKNDIQEAVGANKLLVSDGQSVIAKNDNYVNSRASRTCVGITEDGRVVFMVLDGRQEPFSAGGSYQEIAQIMVDAGCVIAANLDGGGSSTFVAKQEGEDSISVVNRPSDGYERSVSSSLMIVSFARPSNEFDHALITADQEYVTKGTELKLSVSGVSISGGSAEVPEGAVLALTDDTIGSLEGNVFTASASGETKVQLLIGDEIAAEMTIHVVAPDTLKFENSRISAIYGVDTPLPLKAYYEGKEVAISAEDVLLQLDNESAGTLEGFIFNGNEESNIRVVKVTALLRDDFDIDASTQINLYKNGEAVFDFDNATVTLEDGDFAYDRDVPNGRKQIIDEVGTIYHLEDPHEPLDVSYVFAIDMKGIKIPDKIAPMIALLPGGDTVDATPWNFMLQLAERVGTLTEVRVTFKVDPNMDIDYSQLTFANEYFRMDTVEFDEETNTLSIVCHWIKQTEMIDPATANPMCILSGITLTPKDDAPWDVNNYLPVKNTGTISYDVYLRSGTLYNVAQNPNIQTEYGIYPYRRQDVLYNGSPESGGHFGQQYLTFDDEYILDNTVLEGWVSVKDELFYFVDNTMLTGIHEVPGYNDESNMYYYSFNDDGVCMGKVSGLFELDGDRYFAKNGILQSGWQSFSQGGSNIDYYYFDKNTFKAVDGEQVIDGYHYRFEDCILVRGELVTQANGDIWYRWAGDWASQQWYNVDGDKYYFRSNYAAAVNLRSFNIDNVNVYYVFNELGVWQEEANGLYDTPDGNTYLVENGIVVKYPGLVKIGEDYYYFGHIQPYAAYKNAKRWIDKTNGLLPAANYQFDENGKIVFPPAEAEKYTVTFEANGGQGSMTPQALEKDKEGTLKAVEFTRKGYDFTGWNTESDGSGEAYADRESITLTGNLTLYAQWTGKNGIYAEDGSLYYYENGVRTYGGIMVIDGSYYYAATSGEVVHGRKYWISKTNGLLPEKSYEFADDGRIVFPDEAKNGIYEEDGSFYYYENGVRTYGGIMVIDGSYYYAATSGEVVHGRKYWISKTNGLLPEKSYEFADDGKIIFPDAVKNGIYEEDGSLYYYENGVRTYGGVMEIDGDLYYAATSGEVVHGRKYWISKTNGLIPERSYTFDDQGRITDAPVKQDESLSGIVEEDGSLYYYENGIRTYGGVMLIDGNYYYAATSGEVVHGRKYWISKTNGLVKEKSYLFEDDGRMVVNESDKLN